VNHSLKAILNIKFFYRIIITKANNGYQFLKVIAKKIHYNNGTYSEPILLYHYNSGI